MTKRALDSLSAAAGLTLTRRTATADAIVLGHSCVSRTVSGAGELRLDFAPKPGARLSSERAFRVRLGLASAERPNGRFTEDQVATHSGLSPSQVRTLALFDALAPVERRYPYSDLVAARAVKQLYASGVPFPRIVAAAHQLGRRGESLSSVRLGEAPWGEVLQVLEGALAEIGDGQLLLPLEGADLDADSAFALAEEAEQAGDLASSRRWYELAARLDATDPVIVFNLGNVLVDLGQTREAEIAYRQAIARGPDMADAWFNLGILREKTGRESEALASYQRAFAIDPDHADALHNAALLLMRARQFATAVPLLDRILSTSPPNAGEIRRLAHLCRLEARAAQASE